MNLFKKRQKKKLLSESQLIGEKVQVNGIFIGYLLSYSITAKSDEIKIFDLQCVDNYRAWKKRFLVKN